MKLRTRFTLAFTLVTGVALALPALYLLRLLPLPTPDEAAAGFKILHDEFPARRVARFSADATVAVAQVSA